MAKNGTPAPAETPEERLSALDVRNSIEDILVRIGTEEIPETVMPAGNKNTSPIAAKYAVAKTIKGWADRNFKDVEAEARTQGILGDEDMYREGLTTVVWQSPAFDITVKRAKGSTTLDKDRLQEELLKRMSQASLLEVMEEASKPRKGATTIDVAFKS